MARLRNGLRGGVELNPGRYYVYSFLASFNPWAPVYVLLLLDRGFSLTQATALSSVWWLTSVLLEVPTGALADRVSRKASLAVGSFTVAAAMLLFSSGRTYAAMVAVYVLWAAGVTFLSGADAALLYDSLKDAGREPDYGRVYGRAYGIALAAAGLGSVAGGFLGQRDLAFAIRAAGLVRSRRARSR